MIRSRPIAGDAITMPTDEWKFLKIRINRTRTILDKKQFSERDICTKFITPALEQAGWDIGTQIREEFPLTKGRVIVRGKLHTRAQHKRADYVLFYKPNI